jgi:hypothetical protein
VTAVQYRLHLRQPKGVAGSIEVTCDALAAWQVVYGRADPDKPADTARGKFELMSDDGATDFPQLIVGERLCFTASIDGGPDLWVAHMSISAVEREYGDQGAWVRARVDAAGPLAFCGRTLLPADWRFSSPFTGRWEESDAARVAAVLRLVRGWGAQPLGIGGGRSAAGLLMADVMPADAANWPGGGLFVVAANAWTQVRPMTWTMYDATTTGMTGSLSIEWEWQFTVDSTVVVALPDDTMSVLDKGAHTVVWNTPAQSYAPVLRVIAVDVSVDPPWTRAASLGASWGAVPRALTWDGMAAHGGTARLQLAAVRAWAVGADGWTSMVGDMLTERPGDNPDQTALKHIDEVCTATRAVLWERRDGGFDFQPRAARRQWTKESLALSDCDVLATLATNANVETVVNQVTQGYGYPGNPRDSLTGNDATSQYRHGVRDRSNDGPILHAWTAASIALEVLADHAAPVPVLRDVRLKRLEDMPAQLAADVINCPLGGTVLVQGTPGAPAATAALFPLRGRVEQVTLDGSEDGTEVSLTISRKPDVDPKAVDPAQNAGMLSMDAAAIGKAVAHHGTIGSVRALALPVLPAAQTGP